MLKIIIVDDESITRQWIKKKIEELGADYCIEGEFTNGRQALEYCRSNHADIIFTDIRMPRMDGIELLRALTEEDIKIYKVILSAHDEFHYAREALKLGIREFLLKAEITSTEIRRILEKAKKEIEKKEVDKVSGVYQKHIWQELLGSPEEWSQEKLQELSEKEFMEIDCNNLVLISIWLEKSVDVDKIIEIFELFIEEQQLKGICYSSTPQELIAIYNQKSNKNYMKVVEDIYRILQIHLGVKLFIGVSTKRDGFQQLRNLYRQAMQALENRTFFEITGCQFYVNLQIEMDNELYYNSDTKEIFRLVEEERYKEAKENTESLLNHLEQTDFLPASYVIAICNEVVIAYIHEVWKCSLNSDEVIKIRNIELLLGEKVNCFRDLRLRVLEAQEYLSSILIRESETNRYSKPVQEILEYVNNHYGEKIVMGDIAETIHLSRTYISVLFKKETGENLSDYLQRVRLDNAGVLLRTTRKSIKEIANDTGFFDSAHFNRSFKEYYKCSPIEYRKQYYTNKS